MKPVKAAVSRVARDPGLAGQLAVILLVWVFLSALQWRNDGLWYQGDAPRHAINGVFWKDFLQSLDPNPLQFALRYYARYPTLSLVSYPPLFYFFEGVAYAIFGLSPYAAKGMVLTFALLAALYLMAWLRRWVAREVGGMAALLLLLPGFVRFSNAVMLNVPSVALSLAALYHARRWLESRDAEVGHRQFYLAAGLSALAVLTYYPAAIILPIVFGWLVVFRRWDQFLSVRVLMAGLIGVLLMLPWLYVASKWAPQQMSFVTAALHTVPDQAAWRFYVGKVPRMTGAYLLIVAAAGMGTAILKRDLRREFLVLLVYLGAGYAALSLLKARDLRYALIFCAPLICFGAIGLRENWMWLAERRGLSASRAASWMTLIAIAVCIPQVFAASKTAVPRVQGFEELVAFLRSEASADRVLYDGYHDGIFVYYVRAGDSRYRRQVVLGSKLLYSIVHSRDWVHGSATQYVPQVVKALQERGGCRWLAIEIGQHSEKIPSVLLLREAALGSEFKLVRSFVMSGEGIERVDVYRFELELKNVEEVDLPFPNHPEATRIRVRPITE